MKKEIDKTELIALYESGHSVAALCEETDIPRSTLYSWLQLYKKKKNKSINVALTQRHFRDILNRNERLESMVEILQTVQCSTNATLKEKLYELEKLYGQYSVRALCDALQVDRGTFYNHVLRNKKDKTTYASRKSELSALIKKEYDDSNQIFGANKITVLLKNQGIKVSESTVSSLMREMGISSLRIDAKEYYKNRNKKRKNIVNQDFQADRPNQVWFGDITEFRHKERTYHICVIIDLFSRRVVAHKVSMRGSTNLTKATFKLAYESRNINGDELVFHSDRGGTYLSYSYMDYLKKLNVEQSVSRAHVPFDNSVIESFFANLKREELYRKNYRSEKELLQCLDKYIDFYNTKRPHSSIKHKTPAQKEDDFALSKIIDN